jgi:hypothetical protein
MVLGDLDAYPSDFASGKAGQHQSIEVIKRQFQTNAWNQTGKPAHALQGKLSPKPTATPHSKATSNDSINQSSGSMHLYHVVTCSQSYQVFEMKPRKRREPPHQPFRKRFFTWKNYHSLRQPAKP